MLITSPDGIFPLKTIFVTRRLSRSYEIRRIILRDSIKPRQLTLGTLWESTGLPYDLTGPLASHVGRFHLVGPLPHLAQTYGAVEPVEDR